VSSARSSSAPHTPRVANPRWASFQLFRAPTPFAEIALGRPESGQAAGPLVAVAELVGQGQGELVAGPGLGRPAGRAQGLAERVVSSYFTAPVTDLPGLRQGQLVLGQRLGGASPAGGQRAEADQAAGLAGDVADLAEQCQRLPVQIAGHGVAPLPAVGVAEMLERRRLAVPVTDAPGDGERLLQMVERC